MEKKRITILASGTGSNAVRLINHFKGHPQIQVSAVISNKKDARVLTSAEELGIRSVYNENSFMETGEALLSLLREFRTDWIILAGYLRLIPAEVISEFNGRIINIHPSLLPLYGGKGMYGSKVHEAVIADKRSESGITIHFVNSKFDEGDRIAQFFCTLEGGEGVGHLEAKIRKLEHAYFPLVVEQVILQA